MTIFLFRLMFVLFELFCVMYPLVRWLTLFVILRGIEMLAIIIIIIVQRFPLYAAFYLLSYREVVAIKHKTALKNPQRHLWQIDLKAILPLTAK